MTVLAPSLEQAAQRWGDRPAVTFGDERLTYAELWERVLALIGAYQQMGIAPGDRVLCQLPNTLDHVVALGAALHLGAVHVGADNDLTGPELVWLVERMDAAALVFSPRRDSPDPMGPLAAVRRDCPGTRTILGGGSAGDAADASLDEMVAAGYQPVAPAGPVRGPGDPSLVFLTSGTTGHPKGVPETMEHCWAKMQFFADAFRPGADDTHLLFLPMAHVFGLRLSLIPLLTGGRLVLLDRFSPAKALGLVTDEGVTVLPAMPTHLTLLLRKLDPASHDVGSLRWVISAAAGLPRPVADETYERLGVDILFVYGCSEGFTIQTTDRHQITAGSVGKVVFRGPPGTAPDGTVAVHRPDDATPLPAGEVGEVVFGAAKPVEYWGAPAVATDGWYRTGDLGRIDPDGSLFLLGRLNELVNRGGLKVSPAEVEEVARRHPGVVDAAVVGMPEPVLGEAVCACIVAGDNAPDLVELRDFLGTSLARHKLPDELCQVDTIPRTRIGKVDRAALALTVARQGTDRERLRPTGPRRGKKP